MNLVLDFLESNRARLKLDARACGAADERDAEAALPAPRGLWSSWCSVGKPYPVLVAKVPRWASGSPADARSCRDFGVSVPPGGSTRFPRLVRSRSTGATQLVERR